MDHISENFFNDENNSNDLFPTIGSSQSALNSNLELLRAMGFSDEDEIRQALTISKNDINEAVAILTNEKLPRISTLGSSTSKPSVDTTSTTTPNPSGNEVVMNSDSNSDSPSSSGDLNNNNNNNNNGSKDSNETFKSTSDSLNPLVFPYDCLVSLENSVFTDNWSIPYKKDEWLDRLLTSTIAHIKEGKLQDCILS